MAAFLAGQLLASPVPSASADDHLPPYIAVSKSVDNTDLVPGDQFTYSIQVSCVEESCLDAQFTDFFPAELEGFAIEEVTTAPPATTIPRDIVWSEGGSTIGQPAIVGAATGLTVDFTASTSAPVGTGLEFGNTFTVQIRMQVPMDLPPGAPYEIVNTADVTATNSAPDSDDATVTITVPTEIGVGVTKSWGPSPQSFDPGQSSTIGLAATNTSNVALDAVIIQEPATAVDGSASLDASNPFTITDFTGFASSLPAGATTVTVDAYVHDSGSWSWVTGSAAPSPALPAGVDPADVGGLRFSFAGEVEPGATATVDVTVAQRSTHRNTDADLSTQSHTVNNVAEATAIADGEDPASSVATATYTVNPATLAVSALKNISPDRISAGDTASATIGATNESDVGVNELRLADLGYFTTDITFGGFTTGPTWPPDADTAMVVYHPLGGGTPEEVPFTEGATPASPSGPISGFEIVFSASGGAIEPAASTNATFGIATSEDATGSDAELPTTNTVATSVTAPNGLSAENDASDDLLLVTPSLDIDFAKRILPTPAVYPGDAVVTELSATLTTTSDYVTATQIVIEDAWDGGGDVFWDAFNLASIAATQVPTNTSLTIEVQTAVGTWVELEVFPAEPGPFIVSMNTAEVSAALAPIALGDVTGVRFTFENVAGFANDTTVTPYLVTTARSTLRSGGPTTPGPDVDVAYDNLATTTGAGTTPTGTDLLDQAQAVGTATITTDDGAGVGSVGIDKTWSEPTVPAQSSARRDTALHWGSTSGFEAVGITDPVNPTDPANSVFQVFDLVSIAPIAFGPLNQPFTNGWFLRYDTITAVELYRGGAWETVSPPGSGWIGASGFVGYELSGAEREDTTGVRITLSENTVAREAAMSAGAAYDPFAPAPGSGVAASSDSRSFTLTWEIRDTTRVGGDWVTAEDLYNVAGNEGVVDNTVGISGTPLGGGTTVTNVGNDTIVLVDPGPGVLVEKSVVADDPTYVPRAGSTDPADYPTATFSITANNDSVARASYVRVMDPARCAGASPIGDCQSAGTVAGALADPFDAGVDWISPDGVANPFDRYDLVDVTIAASIAAEVDLAASTVWLLRYDAGNYTTEQTTALAVNALGEAALADVIGLSVTFAGTDPAVSGGTITAANDLQITLDSRLRTTIRSTGEPLTLIAGQTANVHNSVFAQSYDPVLHDGEPTGDRDGVTVVLTGGDINVAPSKSVSPSTITEPERDQPVTVTLGANQGLDPRSTLSPALVWLRDDIDSSPEFWDHFQLTGLGSISAPAGADRVTVDVLGPFGAGGVDEWVIGTPVPIGDAALPIAVDDYAAVEGVRFSFTRDDGAFFSATVPAPNWSASAAFTVVLRDTYRGSGDPIVLPVGDTTTVPNTVWVQSDRLTGEASVERSASASIDLTAGSFELSVNKLANDGNQFAGAGQIVPWDLTFQNSGTGFLTITELRDTLPPSLVHLGDPAPTSTGDVDGLLSEDVSFVQDGEDLIFTWPADGRTMAPGETFSIRIHLELQPVPAGFEATNTMTVRTEEELDSCSNIATGGDTTGAWDGDATTCGTTDFVQPTVGPNLFTVKGVRGEVEGAFNPANPDQLCPASLSATGGDYYRAPCAANSRYGGTDDWVLRVLNAGTVDVDEITIFDQLPVAGDRLLVSGTSRGSAFRPQIVPGSLAVNAPGGTDVVLEVTTDADVCQGTWANLENHEPCEQNGETWVEADGSTDWSQVTGLRVHLDFGDTGAGALTISEFVDITFSTTNPPASPADPDGAPVDVPVVDAFAWNQFGLKYLNAGSSSYNKLAPSRVGVHLPSGPVQVDKVVLGSGAAYAADEFLVNVSCEIEGAEVAMGDAAVVALNDGNDFSFRIDGIPLGSSCVIEEHGDVGEFGETAREGTPADIDVAVEAGPDDEVPSAQVATITNVYETAGLSISKQVETDASGVGFGPFDFILSCESLQGVPVTFDGDGTTELTFSLDDGASYTVPDGVLPAGARCTLEETDSSYADDIVITGPGVTDLGDGTATIEVSTDGAVVQVTNRYEAGTLTVAKLVDGGGAEHHGHGPFGFEVVCTYQEQTVLDVDVEIDADSSRVFGPYPAGTECAVNETSTGGATDSSIDPADGVVVIGGDDAEPVVVTATNTFEAASLEITKAVAGDLWLPGASGPFTVALACTWLVDGIVTPVVIPGGSTRQLAASDDVSATFDSLPVGATCGLTETATGGATDISITVSVPGAEPSVSNGPSVSFDLPSSESAGAVEVTIENTFVTPVPPTLPPFPPTTVPPPTTEPPTTEPPTTEPPTTDPPTTVPPTTVPPTTVPPPTTDDAEAVPPPPGTGVDGQLPSTGSTTATSVVLAGLLILLGVMLLGVRRRRVTASGVVERG